MESINLYVISKDITVIKDFIEKSYQDIHVYGTNNIELVSSDVINQSHLSFNGIVVAESQPYNNHQISKLFGDLKDLCKYVIKCPIFYIFRDDKHLQFAKDAIAGSPITMYTANIGNNEFTDIVINESVLYPILKTQSSYIKMDKADANRKINTYQPVDKSLISEDINVSQYMETNIRHSQLFKQIEDTISSSENLRKGSYYLDREAASLIEELQAGVLGNKRKENISVKPATSKISKLAENIEKNDSITLKYNENIVLLEKELDIIKNELATKPNNKELVTKLMELNNMKQRVESHKDKHVYEIYNNLMKTVVDKLSETVEEKADILKQRTAELAEALKYEQTEEKISQLMKVKEDLTQELKTFTLSIKDFYKEIETSYKESVTYLETKALSIRDEVQASKNLPEAVVAKKIDNAMILAVEAKNIKLSSKVNRETLGKMITHLQVINKSLVGINVVNDVIIAEQKDYIDVLKTQNIKKELQVKDRLATKLTVIVGNDGVGKTFFGANSAVVNSKKETTLLIDLNLYHPQLKYYTGELSCLNTLVDFLTYTNDLTMLDKLNTKDNLCVIENGATLNQLMLMTEKTEEEIITDVLSKLESCSKIYDRIIVISPSIDTYGFEGLVDRAGTVIVICDLNISNMQITAKITDYINEVKKHECVKIFLLNKHSDYFKIDIDDVFLRCGINNTVFKISKIPYINECDSYKFNNKLIVLKEKIIASQLAKLLAL